MRIYLDINLKDMPSVFLVILHLITGDIYKVPVGVLAKQISCHQALERVATFDETNGAFYKGKRIFMYYCKDEDGQWIP